jgi:hypothetical protein
MQTTQLAGLVRSQRPQAGLGMQHPLPRRHPTQALALTSAHTLCVALQGLGRGAWQ